MPAPLLEAPPFVLAASLAGLAACAPALPPAMSAASFPAPRFGGSEVVFVRPDSRCDTNDYSVIVDDRGHFVANLAPGTRVTIPVEPGSHVFYSWNDEDLLVEKEPTFNPVAAARVQVAEAQRAYVALLVVMQGYDCASTGRSWVDMSNVRRGDDLANELGEWIHSTKELVPNLRVGQAALDAQPAHVEKYLLLGASKLRLIEEHTANRESVEARDVEKKTR